MRAMLLAALDRAGGEDYLLEQATANPKAFMSLLGRLIPTQVTGKDDAPLIPDAGARDARILALLVKAGLSESEARAALDLTPVEAAELARLMREREEQRMVSREPPAQQWAQARAMLAQAFGEDVVAASEARWRSE